MNTKYQITNHLKELYNLRDIILKHIDTPLTNRLQLLWQQHLASIEQAICTSEMMIAELELSQTNEQPHNNHPTLPA